MLNLHHDMISYLSLHLVFLQLWRTCHMLSSLSVVLCTITSIPNVFSKLQDVGFCFCWDFGRGFVETAVHMYGHVRGDLWYELFCVSPTSCSLLGFTRCVTENKCVLVSTSPPVAYASMEVAQASLCHCYKWACVRIVCCAHTAVPSPAKSILLSPYLSA